MSIPEIRKQSSLTNLNLNFEYEKERKKRAILTNDLRPLVQDRHQSLHGDDGRSASHIQARSTPLCYLVGKLPDEIRGVATLQLVPLHVLEYSVHPRRLCRPVATPTSFYSSTDGYCLSMTAFCGSAGKKR